jgi:hypothetical protein
MLIQKYNQPGQYVFLRPNDFVREKDFYEELMRIQFNHHIVHPCPVTTLLRHLNLEKKSVDLHQRKSSQQQQHAQFNQKTKQQQQQQGKTR